MVGSPASIIVNRLKEYRNQHYVSGRNQLPKHIGDLVYTNPFAFLVGAIFNRRMDWKKVQEIPYYIRKKGKLDAATLAAMTEDKLEDLLRGLDVKPVNCREGAQTLKDAATLVQDLNGDACAIWRGYSPAEVEKRLQRIRGVGSGIASMITFILHDDFQLFQGQEWQIDIKPDTHVVRVFQRTGLTRSPSANEARRAAWMRNPDFPGELDWPAVTIGREWCHAKRPTCRKCPLTKVCPKLIAKT